MITKRLLFVLAAGIAALVTACGGGSKAAQSPPSHPVASHSSPAKHASGGIPQHNGGDHDSDNNGGPSDGDGNF